MNDGNFGGKLCSWPSGIHNFVDGRCTRDGVAEDRPEPENQHRFEPVLAKNTTANACTWCSDGLRCAFAVTDAGWTDYACVRHVHQYWPGLIPADRRPVQDATVFKMLMVVSGRRDAVVGKWEHFNDFTSLFRAARSITGGRGVGQRFTDGYSATNSHYNATGHHRMVFHKEPSDVRTARTHVIIHVLVK